MNIMLAFSIPQAYYWFGNADQDIIENTMKYKYMNIMLAFPIPQAY